VKKWYGDAATHIHPRRVQKALRLARPLLPISIASFALGYLIWAFRIVTM